MPRRRSLTVHIAKGFEEADQWDVQQQLAMTPEERQAAARELRRRVYGKDCPDIRESERSW